MKSRIRELRKALKLSQTAFAQRLGVSQESIVRWERASAPESRVIAICQTFGASRDWLETGNGEMFAGPTPQKEREAALNAVATELYKSLGDDGRRIALALARKLLEREDSATGSKEDKRDVRGVNSSRGKSSNAKR